MLITIPGKHLDLIRVELAESLPAAVQVGIVPATGFPPADWSKRLSSRSGRGEEVAPEEVPTG